LCAIFPCVHCHRRHFHYRCGRLPPIRVIYVPHCFVQCVRASRRPWTSLSEGFILLWLSDRGPVGWRVWPSSISNVWTCRHCTIRTQEVSLRNDLHVHGRITLTSDHRFSFRLFSNRERA
jgi:hypothetical protein